MSTATAPATLSPAPTTTVNGGSKVERKGNIVVKWITTTDHKTIGYLYLITSFIYFCIGGVLALVMRAELFTPGLDVVGSNEQYNQLFTMHGTI
ncbi:MAG: cbb3-type cytochrome c oxidase subunit I, partial [Pseudolysinimonas sp.]